MASQGFKLVAGAMAAIAVVAGVATLINRTYAAAVVGETRSVEVAKPAAATIDKLRAEYRRPEFIPFPKDNPYTVEKAALGKKLYFDTRLSSGNLLSCASCHSPAYGFGDGQPTGVGHLMKALG